MGKSTPARAKDLPPDRGEIASVDSRALSRLSCLRQIHALTIDAIGREATTQNHKDARESLTRTSNCNHLGNLLVSAKRGLPDAGLAPLNLQSSSSYIMTSQQNTCKPRTGAAARVGKDCEFRSPPQTAQLTSQRSSVWHMSQKVSQMR